MHVSRSPERLAFVDFLRGAAFCWVLLFHAQGYGLLPDLPHADPLLAPLAGAISAIASLGYLGVHLFLVLSGVSLAYGPLRRAAPLDIKGFAWRRAKRILPPYWVALVLFAALAYLPASPLARPTLPWWQDVGAHALLIHNLSPKTVLTIDGSFWSLGLEMQWYLCFPLALWSARRFGWRRTLAGALLLALVWQRAVWEYFPHETRYEIGNATYWALPGRLFEFVCGMFAAVIIADRGKRWPAATRGAGILAAILFPLAALATKAQPGKFGVGIDSLWGIIFAALVVVLSAVPEEWFADRRREGNGARSWIASAPFGLVGVGTISYSLYLIHEPILRLVSSKALAALAPSPMATFAAFWLLALPLVIMAGRVFYRLVEAPRQFKRARESAPVVAA